MHLHEQFGNFECDRGAWYSLEWKYGERNTLTIHPGHFDLGYIGQTYSYKVASDFDNGE